MQLKLIKNIWKSNENASGFYCINFFEYSKQNPDLKELLDSGILNDAELCKLIEKIGNQYLKE